MSILKSWIRINENNSKANKSRREKANERRRDIRVEKSAGIWDDPRDKYLNSAGKPKADIVIPVWFLNIYKTWNRGSTSDKEAWNKWCNSQIDHSGIDPRKKKRPVGRPRLPQHLKTEPIKVKRSDKMEQLLLEHDIHLTKGKQYAPIHLTEYPEWEFLPNGRVRDKENNIISVFKFLSNLATV